MQAWEWKQFFRFWKHRWLEWNPLILRFQNLYHYDLDSNILVHQVGFWEGDEWFWDLQVSHEFANYVEVVTDLNMILKLL